MAEGTWTWEAAAHDAEMLTRDMTREFEARSGGHPQLLLVAAKEALRYLEAAQRNYVREARDRGANWGEIGAALGVSKQAARQKYGNMAG